jgi:four helix bundle protein
MFDFEKLEVYKRAKHLNAEVSVLLSKIKADKVTHDQLRRASFSIMLNIAEGSGRFTKADKKNFYVIARGSIFECVAILDYLKDQKAIQVNEFDSFYKLCEEISKMLFSLIKGLEQ